MLHDLQEIVLFHGIFFILIQRRHRCLLCDQARLVFYGDWNVPHRETGLRGVHAWI